MKFKRLLSLSLTVVLIFSMLSACKKSNSPTIENISSKEETKTEIKLAETIEKTDIEGFFKLGADIKIDSSDLDIKTADNVAYIFSNMGDSTKVVSFSVFENSVLGEATIAGDSLYCGVLKGGEYYGINLKNATIYIFSKNGELKKESKICDAALNFGFADGSGQYVIYQKADSGYVNRFDLLKNDTLQSEKEYNLVGTSAGDEKYVYLKDKTGRHYKVAFESFIFEKTKTEAFREYVDCVGVATEKEYFTHTLLSSGVEKYMTQCLNKNEKIVAAKNYGFITVSEKTKHNFRVYDTQSGMATGEIEAEGKILDAQFVNDKYIFVAAEDFYSAEKFYRLFSTIENNNKIPINAFVLDEEKIYESVFGKKEGELNTEVQDFAHNYMVRFLYGSMGADFNIDYSYKRGDAVDVLPKLKIAKKVLDVLPYKMLMEITGEREIWVFFCTDIENKGKEYSSQAALTELYNHKLILIDSTVSDQKFAELFCHQLAHIIDDYFPQSVKNGFSNITPEKIKSAAYTNNYEKISDDKYTPYDKDNTEVWFYNNYCRINEKEDRVITLGEMFRVHAVPSSGENFGFDNIMKKAGYLSHALEETFDYCANNERQLWEVAYPYTEE